MPTRLQEGLLQKMHNKTQFCLILFLFYFKMFSSCFLFLFKITFLLHSSHCPFLFPLPIPHLFSHPFCLQEDILLAPNSCQASPSQVSWGLQHRWARPFPFFFFERVSLCSSDWPQTLHSPALDLQSLGSQVHTNHAQGIWHPLFSTAQDDKCLILLPPPKCCGYKQMCTTTRSLERWAFRRHDRIL